MAVASFFGLDLELERFVEEPSGGLLDLVRVWDFEFDLDLLFFD